VKTLRTLAAHAAAIVLIGISFRPMPALGEEFVAMQVKGPVAAWVLDENSGRVFAAHGDSAVVEEFDPVTGKSLRQFDVGDNATGLLIKGNRLIAGIRGQSALCVIDLAKNAVAGRIGLDGTGPFDMCCSKADNPFVYVCCARQGSNLGSLYQVDIAAMKVVKPVAEDQANQLGFFPRQAISEDGRWFARTGRNVYSVDEDKGVFRETQHGPVRAPCLSAVPGNRFWLSGDLLVPIDLKDEDSERPPPDTKQGIPEFAGLPIAVLPKFDLVVSGAYSLTGSAKNDPAQDSRELTFQRFSDAQMLKTVTLPAPATNSDDSPQNKPEDKPASPPGSRPGIKPLSPRHRRTILHEDFEMAGHRMLQFDPQHDRLLFGQPDGAFVLSLTELKVPLQPLVAMKEIALVKTTLGSRMAIPLELTDADLQAKCQFKLVSGPSGAHIDGNQLVWTPQEADLGEHEWVVAAEIGDSKDQMTVRAQVHRSAVALGGVIDQLNISPSGDRALVLTETALLDPDDGAAGQRFHVPRVRGVQTRLVLVDLKKSRIVATRLIDKPVGAICLTDQAAYFVPRQTAAVYQLNLEDLADKKHVFLSSSVQEMAPLPLRRIGVQSAEHIIDDSKGGFTALDEATLARVEMAGAGAIGKSGPGLILGNSMNWLDPLNDGSLRFDALVIDERTASPRLIWHPMRLGAVNAPRQFRVPRIWNRTVNDQSLAVDDNSPIVNWDPARTIALRKYPVAVSVRAKPVSDGHPFQGRFQQHVQLSMEFRALTDGTSQQSMVLDQLSDQGELEAVNQFRVGQQGRVDVADAGDQIIVGYADRLYAVPISADRFGGLPQPLQILPELDKLQAPLGEKVELALTAVGGKGARRFSLSSPAEGVAVDEATGKVTLDTRQIWEAYKRDLQSPQPKFTYLGGNATDELISAAQKSYHDLTGKTLDDKFPLASGVNVAVTDSEQATAELTAQFIVLAPKADLEPILAAIHSRQSEVQSTRKVRSAPGAVADLASQAALVQQAKDLVDERITELDTAIKRSGNDLADLKASVARIGDGKQKIDALQRITADNQTRTEALQAQCATIGNSVERQQTWLLAGAGLFAAAQFAVIVLLLRRGGKA